MNSESDRKMWGTCLIACVSVAKSGIESKERITMETQKVEILI